MVDAPINYLLFNTCHILRLFMDNLSLFQFSVRTACDERAGAGPGGGPPGLSGGTAVDRLSQYQCTAHTVLEQSVIEDTTGRGAKREIFFLNPPPHFLNGAGASKYALSSRF